jgi:hypothetical protein
MKGVNRVTSNGTVGSLVGRNDIKKDTRQRQEETSSVRWGCICDRAVGVFAF